MEQVAGDLMPARSHPQRAERAVATGFLAIGPKSHNERSQLQFALDLADEQVDAVTQAFLGLTVAFAPVATTTSSIRSLSATTTRWPASSAAPRRCTAPPW